jgi:hypothetical protein
MRRIILVALITCFAVGAAAQSFDSKAVSANSKPAHGAAKMLPATKTSPRAVSKQYSGAMRESAQLRTAANGFWPVLTQCHCLFT